MSWFNKSVELRGIVLFRGSLPPRLTELTLPANTEVEVVDSPPQPYQWLVEATHPKHGSAQIGAMRNPPRAGSELFAGDFSLSPQEKEAAKQGQATIVITIKSPQGHMLRDRKRLLRHLGEIMGPDGVIALDALSTKCWSRAMLDDELCHDADVDVEALYAVHAIGDASGKKCEWFHTHGLGEIGFYDFDLIRPDNAITTTAADLPRAMAFAVVEGKLAPGATRFSLYQPGGEISAIDAALFDRKAPPDERAVRNITEGHTERRFVVGDPLVSGWRKMFGSPIRASRAISETPEDAILQFSNDATRLMEARARHTWDRFKSLFEELNELQLPALVKLGYKIDGATRADQREHLWFKVHGIGADMVNAELINTPFNIAAMKQGQRGEHPIDLLSDWAFMTPLGQITPRSARPLWFIRQHRGEFLKGMREGK